MRESRRSSYVIAILLVAAFAVAAASRERVGVGVAESPEVLTGDMTCGIDFSAGQLFSYYSFQGTGDLFPRSYYGGSQRAEGQSADDCDTLIAPTSAILAGHGCAKGAEARSQDETGASRSFAFVCHGPRSALVSFVAEFTTALLAPSP